MDLNELFFHHQIALMRADRSGDRNMRSRLHAQAKGLATRIGAMQCRLGAPAALLAGTVSA
jgi:hypothetical protein